MRVVSDKIHVILSQCGFKRIEKHLWIKLINDVVQLIKLERINGRYNILWDIKPLCKNVGNMDISRGKYYMSMLGGSMDFISREDMMSKKEDNLFSCQFDELLTFLGGCNNCRDAYKNICSFEKKLFGRMMSNIDKVYMLIKIKDIDNAVFHLEKILEQKKKSYIETSVKLSKESKKRRLLRIYELRKIKFEIQRMSDKELNDMIMRNESNFVGYLDKLINVL